MCAALWLSSALACDEPHTGAFYLDPQGGSDANDCASEATACKTAGRLQTAIGQAGPGTTLLLKRGATLVTTTGFKLDKVSGTEAAPITIGAYGDEDAARPVIDGTGMGSGAMVFSCLKRDWYVIQDLEIKGNKGAIEWRSCHHHVLQRVTTSTCEQECIRIKAADSSSYSSHIKLLDVHMNSTRRAEGVYIGTDPAQASIPDQTQDILIDRMLMENGAHEGGECIEAKAGTQRITIQNSTFRNNFVPTNGCIFSSTGKDPSIPRDMNYIRNNTITNITGESGYGIRWRNNAEVIDNTIENTSQLGIFLETLAGYPIYTRTLSVKAAGK
jgi:hypothetical protein